jgi:hypothetical protein
MDTVENNDFNSDAINVCSEAESAIQFFFIDTFVSLAIPSLQLRLTTSLFSNLDSKLKTNSQYLSIDQCRVQVLICLHGQIAQALQLPLPCTKLATDIRQQ